MEVDQTVKRYVGGDRAHIASRFGIMNESGVTSSVDFVLTYFKRRVCPIL